MTIKVHANVPFGNVCDVNIIESGGAAEVRFAADPHGGPESLWFCFRVERAKGDPKSIKLTMKHSRNTLGIREPATVRPVVRATSGDWERLGPPEVTELPDGRRHVSWVVDAPEAYLDVAFCYPYGVEEVENLVEDSRGYWCSDVIGVSQKSRPLIRLSNSYGEEESDRPGLSLIARQHSSETTGSWVLDGFLRHVATSGEDAPLVWCVPLANIDGVLQGDYGKDNFPWDVNRAWGRPPMRHETRVFQEDIGRWRARCRPALGIDFHSPGGAENRGVYTFVPDPKEYGEAHKMTTKWTAAVRKALGDEYAAEEFDRVADYASRWETPNFSRYFFETLELPAFVVETSYSMSGELVLTRGHYREIGKRIAEGVIAKLSADPKTEA